MNFNDLIKQSEKILQKQKTMCSAELSLLVESTNLMLGMMFELCSNLTRQNEQQTKLLKQSEQNERLTATIQYLQSTVKDLRRQFGQNSNNSSKPLSKDGYMKPKSRSLI